MWWIIAAVVLACLVLGAFVMSKQREAREQERWRRRQAEIAELRAKLKPGVRFRAHGTFGNTIKGQVIKVINSNTIEAWCKAYDDQPGETGPFPIDRIYEVTE